jgi:hypothetical protein
LMSKITVMVMGLSPVPPRAGLREGRGRKSRPPKPGSHRPPMPLRGPKLHEGSKEPCLPGAVGYAEEPQAPRAGRNRRQAHPIFTSTFPRPRGMNK